MTDPMPKTPQMAVVVVKNIAAFLRGDLSQLTRDQMLVKLQIVQAMVENDQ